MTFSKGCSAVLFARIRSRIVCLLCTLPIALSFAARAEEQAIGEIGLTTGELYRICGEAPAQCTAYLSGVVDTALLNHHLFSQSRDRGFVGPGQITFCFSEEKQDADLPRVFMDFVDALPERRDFAAAESVMLALGEAFPCPAVGAE